MLKRLLSSVTFYTLILSQAAWSNVFAPFGQELRMQFSTSFITKQVNSSSSDEKVKELIRSHYNHFLGFWKSETLVNNFQIWQSEGIGSIRSPGYLKNIRIEKKGNGFYEVSYSFDGRALMIQEVADQYLLDGVVEAPLPYDLDNYYDKKCTDAHYTNQEDFFYFYDPYRSGCEYLSNPPYAILTDLHFSTLKIPSANPVRLDLLRGDNQNGKLFKVYIFHGPESSNVNGQDEGRQSFRKINTFLKVKGFHETIKWKHRDRPRHIYQKSVTTKNGFTFNLEIDHLFVESGRTELITFAEVFSEAVKDGDVVIYTGHSGLGGNLNIEALDQRLLQWGHPPMTFTPRKRQLFYFDSCASYTYYLGEFSKRRGVDGLDVITNGFASIFNESHMMIEKLIATLASKNDDITWQELLTKMESSLKGYTYLLNVGHL